MPELRACLSYANVTATLALTVALAGGAYAAVELPKNSVGAKQISAGAVRSAEVKNNSLRAKDFKQGQLPAGPQGPPGAGAARLWAVVAADGTLVRGNGVTAVTKLFVSEAIAGSYQVAFDRDVANCAFSAVLGRTDAADFDPDPGLVGVAYRNGVPNAVYVKTRNPAGTAANLSFHVAAFC